MPLRDAEPGDLPAMTDIYAHHVLHGTGTFEEEPPGEAEMARRIAAVQDRRLPWLVAEEDGRILGFAYLGLICTGLAYVLWFRGLAGLPARTVGILGLLNPLAGTILGALVAGELLSPVQALGAATILLGVGLGLLTTPKRRLRR